MMTKDLSRFDKNAAILTDVTRCTGCETCVAACKLANGLGPDRPRRWKTAIDDLSSTRFTTIIRSNGRFVRKQCRHCAEPACVSACIVGALTKTKEGPVVFNRNRCMGCRYCMMSCPYGIPRYNWESPTPYLHKCTLCYERVKDGQQPACTAACPHGATMFGTRKELLAEAHRRLDEKPQLYKVRKVFGETEIGGASVLYISDVPLGALGWKADFGDDPPLPARTWAALSKVPWMVGGVGLGMLGVWWVIGRRMKHQAQAALAAVPASPEDRRGDAERSDAAQ